MYDDRSGSDSRCCRPSEVPYRWCDVVDEKHPAVVALDGWLSNLPRFAMLNELGRIDDLFEAAAGGELLDPGDVTTQIKPIRRDPELWELRYQALSKPLRFYHAEPEEAPDAMVKIHRHIKTGNGDQQAQIEYAASRYHLSDPNEWDPQ